MAPKKPRKNKMPLRLPNGVLRMPLTERPDNIANPTMARKNAHSDVGMPSLQNLRMAELTPNINPAITIKKMARGMLFSSFGAWGASSVWWTTGRWGISLLLAGFTRSPTSCASLCNGLMEMRVNKILAHHFASQFRLNAQGIL